MQKQLGTTDTFDGRRRPTGAIASPARRAPAPTPPRPPSVAATEARLELLSRQLVMLGEAMRRRVAEAERRGQAEADDVRQELRRAREELQRRIDRAEQSHRELQQELGRVAESLIERLDEGERRQVEGLDSLRGRLASVADVAEARHAEASRRLLLEMDRSEARTAERIVEAVAQLEARVLSPPAPVPAPAPAPAPEPEPPQTAAAVDAGPAPDLRPAPRRRPVRSLILASAFGLGLALVAIGVLTLRDGLPPAPRPEAPPKPVAGPPAPSLRTVAPAPAPATAPPGPAVQPSPPPAAKAPAQTLPSATARLMARAGAGDAGAALSLAALYVQGGGGLPRNPGEARRWASRAALAGNVGAMHGLGTDYLRGVNGPADPAVAARWFRMAAERGAVESAVALGRLYEAGRGVPQDARLARRWYGLAARAGDKGAQARLQVLETGDPPIIPGRVQSPTAPAGDVVAANRAAGANADVVELQQLLARLGYYLGPIDGVASPDLDQALTDYRKGRRGSAPATP